MRVSEVIPDKIIGYLKGIGATPVAYNVAGHTGKYYSERYIWIVCVLKANDAIKAFLAGWSKSSGVTRDGVTREWWSEEGWFQFPTNEVDCGTTKKPRWKLLLATMKGTNPSGNTRYSRSWNLFDSEETTSLSNSIKFFIGSKLSEKPSVNPNRMSSRDLKKNKFCVVTLKGGLCVAVKESKLFCKRGQHFEAVSPTIEKIEQINNDQLLGLFLFWKEAQETGRSSSLESFFRERKDKTARCFICHDTIEHGESVFYCRKKNRYSHVIHYQSSNKQGCPMCLGDDRYESRYG